MRYRDAAKGGSTPRSRTRDGIRRGLHGLAVSGLVILGVTGCDSLLDVELPGQVRGEDLEQARLAETMIRSVEGDFDCALSEYVRAVGLWAHDFYFAGNQSRDRLTQERSREVETFEQGPCDFTGGGGAVVAPQLYLPFQTVRVQGENATSLIEGLGDDESVPDRELLLAKAYAYTGYAYQILGETMCELAFDGGPLVTREDSWSLAEERFTSAIAHASQSSAAEAESILNMALVGRARTRLNRGDAEGVVEDASRVPTNFIRYAEMDASEERRYNSAYEQGIGNLTVHPSYTDLSVNGTPDPRVPVVHHGVGVGFDGVSDIWEQLKYTDYGSDIPFATGREAQLMIAEVSGGQTAVDIINALRAGVSELPWVPDGHPGLAAFSRSDATTIFAQVWEERRRELYLQGTKLGDMLRLDVPQVTTDDFETGVNQRGSAYGPHTCYPLPDQERLGNPNIPS